MAYGMPKLPWMIDFVDSNPTEVPAMQVNALKVSSTLEHTCSLSVHSKSAPKRLTGIACIIGKKLGQDIPTLEKIMEAGMTTARISLVSGTKEELGKIVKNLREAALNYGKKIGHPFSLAIALDTRGAEIRTGYVEDIKNDEIELNIGTTVILTMDPAYMMNCNSHILYINYKNFANLVKVGDLIYLDHGSVCLEVVTLTKHGSIKCTVQQGGTIVSHSPLCVPGVPFEAPLLSDEDIIDLNFAVEFQLDVVLVSMTQCESNIREVRKRLAEDGDGILVFGKVETIQALDHADSIIEAADGIYISRGTLQVDVGPEKLFIAQKCLIAKCNKLGKPVMTNIHFLFNITETVQPPRSELTDVANIVLDGVDCISLSRETFTTPKPAEYIRVLAHICREAEAAMYSKQIFSNLVKEIYLQPDPTEAIAIATVDIAIKCNAAAIVVTTTTGRSATVISKYKPRCPVIAITRYAHIARQMNLWRGIEPLLFIERPIQDWMKDVDRRLQYGITYGKMAGLIQAGDVIILLNGCRQGAGFTNNLRIFYASEYDALPKK